MARAKPASLGTPEVATVNKDVDVQEISGPVINYYGEGAKDIKVDIDPKAKKVDIYGDGKVLVDY